MASYKKTNLTKVIVTISFFIMIIVNLLSNVLPINGITTGQVSDDYKNLFAPAGITFSIWGVIYLLLLGYTIYQFFLFKNNETNINEKLYNKIGLFFTLSSITNALWIFCWHYKLIPLTVILMLIILISLIIIVMEIKKVELRTKEKIFIKIPFSVYFGWITVATIANITVFLVSIGWNGFGIPEHIWAVAIIFIGLIIGIITTLKNKDIAYGLVIIWAYIGILIKHISVNGFNKEYPSVINTVIICILFLLITQMYVLIINRK
jgi:hypothetical protein